MVCNEKIVRSRIARNKPSDDFHNCEELCKRREMGVVCSSGDGLHSLGKLDRVQSRDRILPADHKQHDLRSWNNTFCGRYSTSSQGNLRRKIRATSSCKLPSSLKQLRSEGSYPLCLSDHNVSHERLLNQTARAHQVGKTETKKTTTTMTTVVTAILCVLPNFLGTILKPAYGLIEE